eukprot:g21720.t1
MVSEFVDDTKIGGIVDNKEDFLRLQKDLDQMGQWARKWQMEFNLDKCELPSYRKEIFKLERVEKRFTRILLGTEGLSSQEWLDRLGRFSLE